VFVQNLLQPPHEVGQQLDRNPHVLDKRHRLGAPLDAEQTRQGGFAQLPDFLERGRVVANRFEQDRRPVGLVRLHQGAGQLFRLSGGIPFVDDEENRFDAAGDHRRDAVGLVPLGQGDQPAVEKFAGGGAGRDDAGDGGEGGVHRGEAEQDERPAAGQGNGAQRRLGEDAERPFRADEQAGQVKQAGVQHAVDRVTAPVEPRERLMGGDEQMVLVEQSRECRADLVEAGRRPVGIVREARAGDIDGVAVVEDDAQRFDVVAGSAMADRGRAGGVVGEHAAEGADLTAAGVGGEASAVLCKPGVQACMHDAGLHADRVGADRDNCAEVAAQVDHQPGAERFAGQPGPRAARDQRNLVFAGVADQGAHVILVAGRNHAGGGNLEDAGVGAVQRAGEVVEPDLPLEEAAQVVAEPTALLRIHRRCPFGDPQELRRLSWGLGLRSRGRRRVGWSAAASLFAQLLLAVAFPRRQLERGVRHLLRETLVMGLAAVADEGVADEQVQRDVERRRADQDRPGQPRLVQAVGDDRGGEGGDEDRHAQRMRKVLLAVQLMAAAEGAMGQGGIAGCDVLAMLAVRALPVAGLGGVEPGGLIAGRAGEDDVQVASFQSGKLVFSQRSWLVSSPRKQTMTTT
jgi:hypothetical protein